MFVATHLSILTIPTALYILYDFQFEKLKYIFQNEDQLIINKQGIHSNYLNKGYLAWKDLMAFQIDKDLQKLFLYQNNSETIIEIPLADFRIKDYHALEMNINAFISS